MEKETYVTPEIASEGVALGGLAQTDGSQLEMTQGALGGLTLFNGSPQLNGPQLNSEYRPPK
jgi:hypothetical protein